MASSGRAPPAARVTMWQGGNQREEKMLCPSLLRGARRHATLTCSAVLLACAWSQAAAQEVKLNEVLRSLFYTPEYVAFRIGAFEQESLKVIGPKTTWGMQAALTEVVSGNSNIVLLGPEAAALT